MTDLFPMEVVYSSDNFENAKVSGGVIKTNVRKDARNYLKKLRKKRAAVNYLMGDHILFLLEHLRLTWHPITRTGVLPD